MKMFYAMWFSDRSLGKSLTRIRQKRRLVSFFFIKYQDITNDQLKQYVEFGQLDPRKKK